MKRKEKAAGHPTSTAGRAFGGRHGSGPGLIPIRTDLRQTVRGREAAAVALRQTNGTEVAAFLQSPPTRTGSRTNQTIIATTSRDGTARRVRRLVKDGVTKKQHRGIRTTQPHQGRLMSRDLARSTRPAAPGCHATQEPCKQPQNPKLYAGDGAAHSAAGRVGTCRHGRPNMMVAGDGGVVCQAA